MDINWREILAGGGVLVGGGSVLLAAAAWLLRELVSSRLALDLEKFKVEMKTKADAEIERVKAFLNRGARVHERQIDTLQMLYRHLQDAQGFLQRMTSAVRMTDEKPEEYAPLVTKAIQSAFNDFLDGRLFIPPALVRQCESFFNVVFEGRQHFALAHHPMVDPVQQAEFWAKAGVIAHQEVPKVLQRIEESARAVIYGGEV